MWRTYYLANMPTISKKLEVLIDWTFNLFFKRDVAMIKRFIAEPGLSSSWNDEIAKNADHFLIKTS